MMFCILQKITTICIMLGITTTHCFGIKSALNWPDLQTVLVMHEDKIGKFHESEIYIPYVFDRAEVFKDKNNFCVFFNKQRYYIKPTYCNELLTQIDNEMLATLLGRNDEAIYPNTRSQINIHPRIEFLRQQKPIKKIQDQKLALFKKRARGFLQLGITGSEEFTLDLHLFYHT